MTNPYLQDLTLVDLNREYANYVEKGYTFFTFVDVLYSKGFCFSKDILSISDKDKAFCALHKEITGISLDVL